MENKDKIEIIIKKSKQFLTFSSTFVGISFPLLLIAIPSSIQDLLKKLILTISLIFFMCSIIFSLTTYNKASSYNLNSDRNNKEFNLEFYLSLAKAIYYLNLIGFSLFFVYILYELNNRLLITFLSGIFIIFCFFILRRVKGDQNETYLKRNVRYLLLCFVVYIFFVIIIFLFIPTF